MKWRLFLCLTLASKALASNLPLVGIVGQYGSTGLNRQFPSPYNYFTYVAGSYVDYVGITGAMPLLIPYDVDKKTLDYLLNAVDMVLIPGGGAEIFQNNGSYTNFGQTLAYIADKAKTFNDNGRYFPMYGICNGFEFFMDYWAQSEVVSCGFNDTYKDHRVVLN